MEEAGSGMRQGQPRTTLDLTEVYVCVFVLGSTYCGYSDSSIRYNNPFILEHLYINVLG